MFLNLMKLMGFYTHDASKPYRVYYNASRFPSTEVAKLYKAVVEIYIKESLDEALVVSYLDEGLPPKDEPITIKFPRLSFLNDGSGACTRMNEEAEKMLLSYEKEMYDRRADELKELYGFFEGFRPPVKTFSEVNELVDFIRKRLKSWTEFEIARMLPIWLFWFGKINESRFHKWYQSIYFEVYLKAINETELPFITQIFDTYISSQPQGVNLNLYAQLN